MRQSAAVLLAACLAGCSTAYAGDWPGWRGPRRDGVAADSPALVDAFDKDGPKKVWESEPIPGGHNGGFAQPTVAAGKVFVFYNCRFDQPIATRMLTRAVIDGLGWAPGIPEDLAKSIETVRLSPERAALKDAKEITPWVDAWVKANVTAEQRKFQAVAKRRLTLGAAALPLDKLAFVEPIVDKEFASEGDLDRWMVERGLAEPERKQIMAPITKTVRACSDHVFCLDRAKGRTEWKQDLTGNWMWYAASSTPVVAEGRCYVLGSGAVAYCLNAADGSVVWKSKPFGAAQHSHNRSSSVLLVDDKAVVSSDTALCALDAKTGETLWSNPQAVGKEASPIAWRAGDRTFILFLASGRTPDQGKLLCIDPADGKIVWSVVAGSTASTPVVAGDVAVFCSATKGIGLAAFRISAEGAKPLWNVPIIDWGTSPVVAGKYVYLVGGGNGTAGFGEAGKGRALCVELETGKIAWDEPLGPGAELSSPVLADGKLIAAVGPWLYLIKASGDKYELLGKANLGLAPWTSPALSDGFLFVRTNKGVACYDLRKQ